MSEEYENSLADLFDGDKMEVTREIDASNLASKDADKIVRALGLDPGPESEPEPEIVIEQPEPLSLPEAAEEEPAVPLTEDDVDAIVDDEIAELDAIMDAEIETSLEKVAAKEGQDLMEESSELEDTSDTDFFDKERCYLILGKVDGLMTAIAERMISVEGVDKIVVAGDSDESLAALKRSYPSVRVVTGNISDKFTLDKIWSWYDPAGVFYLPTMVESEERELEVRDSFSEITVGCSGLLDKCANSGSVDFVIGVTKTSVGVGMGVQASCMRINERLFDQYQSVNGDAFYKMVRIGTTPDSYGSKISEWTHKVKSLEDRLEIPSRDDTIYLQSNEDAVKGIMDCLFYAESGGGLPYVSEGMKSARLGDILDLIGTSWGRAGWAERVVETGAYTYIDQREEFILENNSSSSQSEPVSTDEIIELGLM
jgi:hypothetical protein